MWKIGVLCWQIPLAIDLCIPLLPDSSVKEKMVHIDAFTAMSGVSRFCENEYPWRYASIQMNILGGMLLYGKVS